jgi:hypothetical protein
MSYDIVPIRPGPNELPSTGSSVVFLFSVKAVSHIPLEFVRLNWVVISAG